MGIFTGDPPLPEWQKLALEARRQYDEAAAALNAAADVYEDAARLAKEAKAALDRVTQEQIPTRERITRYNGDLLAWERRCKQLMDGLFDALHQFPIEDEEPRT